jgi:hypothetical protein
MEEKNNKYINYFPEHSKSNQKFTKYAVILNCQ